MMRSLRLPGEGDEAFRARAKRAAEYARILTDAALANRDIQDLIACDEFPMYTEQRERQSPTVRVEFEEAIAIGGIGECIAATKSKSWGAGPYIRPLEPEDPVLPIRITYVFRENSVYNRRYEQRMKLKKLLGKRYRSLVTKAKQYTQSNFLDVLTAQEAYAIRKLLKMEPVLFWRLSKGKCFADLPESPGSLDPAELNAIPDKPEQLRLPFERPRTREEVRHTTIQLDRRH